MSVHESQLSGNAAAGIFIITYKTIIGKDGLFFLNFVLRLRIDSDYRIWTSGTML